MAKHNTGIEWTHHPGYRGETWNPLAAFDKETGERGWFCTHVSPGCANCYAEKMNVERPFGMGTGHEYIHQNLKHIEFRLVGLEKPLRWTKPRCVFVNSMTDLFHEAVPFEMIDRIFAVMALATEHRFLVLTKRPGRMREYLNDYVNGPHRTRLYGETGWSHMRRLAEENYGRELPRTWPIENVWLGTSVENQKTADARIREIVYCPTPVRFLSVEPLLGPVDLSEWIHPPKQGKVRMSVDPEVPVGSTMNIVSKLIRWVIVGGESGPNARPMHPDWVRQIRNQCQAAGVPFFFKQYGAWAPSWGGGDHLIYPDGTLVEGDHEHPDAWKRGKAEPIRRVGKKAAGRTLDGRTWDEFPETKHTTTSPQE